MKQHNRLGQLIHSWEFWILVGGPLVLLLTWWVYIDDREDLKKPVFYSFLWVGALILLFIRRRKASRDAEAIRQRLMVSSQDVYNNASLDILTFIEHLHSLGIQAEPADNTFDMHDLLEVHWSSRWAIAHKGMCNVKGYPISWINISSGATFTESINVPFGRRFRRHMWRYSFGVPDDRLVSELQMEPVNITNVFKENGGTASVSWSGNDYGTGLKEMLSGDSQIQTLAYRVGNHRSDLTIRAAFEHFQGWVIEIVGFKIDFWQGEELSITKEDWNGMVRISQILLCIPTSSQANT